MNRRLDLPQRLALDDDTDLNLSGNPSFNKVLDARLSRRSILRGGVGTAATALLGGWGVAACGSDDDRDAFDDDREARASPPWPRAWPTSVSVPAGYSARCCTPWATRWTPATPAYRNDGTDTDFDQPRRRPPRRHGVVRPVRRRHAAATPNSSERGLLVMNHEATDRRLSCTPTAARALPRPAAESRQGDPAPRRVGGRGAQDRRQVGLRAGLGLQPPHHAADPGRDRRPGARQCADGDQVLARRHQHPRHDQQLRHRPDALGHAS